VIAPASTKTTEQADTVHRLLCDLLLDVVYKNRNRLLYICRLILGITAAIGNVYYR
jgi:hypothetical protein